jgi:hypothetical protein
MTSLAALRPSAQHRHRADEPPPYGSDGRPPPHLGVPRPPYAKEGTRISPGYTTCETAEKA